MTATASQTEASQALMERMYGAAIKGDFDDVLSCLSDDLVVNEPPFLPYGRVYRGLEGFGDLIANVTQVLDVSRMIVDRYVSQGDRVIGIIRMPDLRTGEHILLAEESLIRDGKVVEIVVYFHETRSMLMQERLPGC
ncbi:MAG TPA: nuclear transport factor 2 family protein [Pseudonocardia sp.]|jgi:ketosteroid isomerase-like protein|nr:nuclear transport factor 2 family protein [Pseudonocardia sp.]